MPKSRSRHYFPAVTFTVIVVGIAGLVGFTLRRFIPAPALNALVTETDDFLLAGSRQAIPWRKLNRDTLAEARRTDKPMMLVLGSAGSVSAKITDEFGFADSETAAFIRQNFLPVRADVVAQPYLASMFDPLARSRQGWDPNFQIWFLTPDGRTVGAEVSSGSDPRAPLRNLMGAMRYFKDLIERQSSLPDDATAAGDSQLSQIEEMMEASSVSVRITEYSEMLQKLVDKEAGMWPQAKARRLNLPAVRFLLRHGDVGSAQAALDPILSSGFVDWVNGGAFYQANDATNDSIDFTKFAETNADLAAVCAMLYAKTKQPLYRQVATDTFDALYEQFRSEGTFAAGRLSDATGSGRSDKSSFSPRFLVERFSDGLQARLKKSFLLEASRNPAMLPKVGSPEQFAANQGEIQALLEEMRPAKRAVEQKFFSRGYASVSAHCVARLLETAMLLNDETRLTAAVFAFRELGRFRSGENDVLRRGDSTDFTPAFLGDYTAYANAAFQAFLATGSEATLRDGLAVLLRALEYFEQPRAGALSNSSPEAWADMPPDTAIPEIVDHLTDATQSQAIALAEQYACALQGNRLAEDLPTVRLLRNFSAAAVGRFAQVAESYQINFASFYDAAMRRRKEAFVAVYGREATAKAQELSRKQPSVLVIPYLSQDDIAIVVHEPGLNRILITPDEITSGLEELANRSRGDGL